MAFDFVAGNGREGFSNAGKQKFQVVVYFGRSADCRTRIAGVDLLADGYRWRNAVDEIDFRLVHLSEELPSIRR